MKKYRQIDRLIQESVNTNSNSLGRPALLALTRATTNLIYQDLVATQYTNQPVAALYGVRYLNPNKQLSFVTGATYSGAIGTEERKTMDEITPATLARAKGDYFLYNDVAFKVLVDNPFTGTTETDMFDIISEGIASNGIRIASEAADVEKFEKSDTIISDAKFQVDKWQANVKSRKLQLKLTTELAQDMEANGFDAPEMLEDLLATQMAEEINKDIVQSLITVSSRFKVKGVSDKGVLDLSDPTLTSINASRELYRYICEMNANIQRNTSYSATYVVASSRAAALLTASGWVEQKDDTPENAAGTLKNGMILYCDNNSPVEYVIVGVKADYGEEEMIGSLFYAPFTEGRGDSADPTDHVGAYKIMNDPESLQPQLMLLLRYALCVNPYTMPIDDNQARVVDSTSLDQFAGQSQMSVLLGIKLPKLV